MRAENPGVVVPMHSTQSPSGIWDKAETHVLQDDFAVKVNKNSPADVSRTAIVEFVTALGLEIIPTYQPDIELRQKIEETTRLWEDEEALRPFIVSAIFLTETGYGHILDNNVKVIIALYTALILIMDSPAIAEANNAIGIPQGLCQGSIHATPGLIGTLAKLAKDSWDYFVPFAAGSIVISILDHVNGEMLERLGDTDSDALTSYPFVKYRRMLSGLPDAFSCFIWEKSRFPDVNAYLLAIPAANLVLTYINDILSLYKEELAGETTYIHDRARTTGKPTLEALRDVAQETVAAVEQVRALLGEGDARDAWDSCVQGFVGYHIANPRYRLKEVLGGEYFIDLMKY
ncbi:uncharacterized protein FIBRA_00067 [Fibroporia radiculosa]|uniref:Terpene synthase n=1 Tax=Fibroporia radiculosa TaxID=599839 RepID=J7SCF5_9APHY|nr:uncharacterized protein FIBRA_00067 [Fibroporia radiculosa]CCL98073.1 predicted protein [Fibroporia radiculosa]